MAPDKPSITVPALIAVSIIGWLVFLSVLICGGCSASGASANLPTSLNAIPGQAAVQCSGDDDKSPGPNCRSRGGATLPIRSPSRAPAVQAKAADGAPRPRVISERFLDTLERVESRGRVTAIGDRGRAIGPYQFWAVAWQDVSALRMARGQSAVSYLHGATNRATARSYARTYLGKLHLQLTTALKREPTPAELYAAWNMGSKGFKRRGFSLHRCPATTQRATAQFARL